MQASEDPIPTGEEIWKQAWRQFAPRVNVATMTRAQWRAVCTAKERSTVQIMLVRMAEAAQTASKTERLGLYKAAYAVLPLHGAELREFVGMLLEGPPAPEWADALMLALAEQSPGDNRLVGPLLRTLQALCPPHSADADAKRRASWIAYHLPLLGYHPDWLNGLA